MRFPTYCLLGGLAILLAVGCSYRGKCQSSRFESGVTHCPSCAGSIQPSALQRLRTIQSLATDADLHTKQQNGSAVSVAKANANFSASAIPESQVASSQKSRTNYQIAELVPYENTQLRIPPAKPILSSSKSSRLPFLSSKEQTVKREPVAFQPEPPSDRDLENNFAEDHSPEEAPHLTGVANDVADEPVAGNEIVIDHIVPAADQLTASAKSVLDLDHPMPAEAADHLATALTQQDPASDREEEVLTVPATAGQREPTSSEPPARVIVGKVEQPILLRARPQYRSTFIDEITRKSPQHNRSELQLIPAAPEGGPFSMEPVNFRPLPAIQSADHEVKSPAQQSDLKTAKRNEVSSIPNSRNTLDSIPQMIPIVKQHGLSQQTLPQQTLPATRTQQVPTIQASSKKILKALPQTDRAHRLLQQNSVASPLLNNPTDVLKLRATTGLSSEQQFPPIIRFNTQASSNTQSLEANQIEFNKPNQIRLLPTNVEESSLPSFEHAPMIDHSRVNEAIRRLTVRPDSESTSSAETIDR